MKGVWLERATANDAPALAALEGECHAHPWTPGQIHDEVALGPPGVFLVLRGVGGPWEGLRAYCVHRVVADEMQILNVAVAPEARRQGRARWLLRFAMGHASRAGARRALLEVREGNVAARALYGALGFEPVGVRRDYYTEPLEDAVVLARDPRPPTDP